MQALRKALQTLGYYAEIDEDRDPSSRREYNINTRGSGKFEKFVISVQPGIDIVPLDTQIDEEAVLVMVQDTNAIKGRQNVAKLLLGHDERQLFVAAVPLGTKDVAEAKDRLKPAVVHDAEKRAGVKSNKKNKHRNAARIRQGDFFFVPASETVNESLILRNEPLNRGLGRSHMVDEIVRVGGEAGYENAGNFLTTREYDRLPKEERERRVWRQTRRNPRVYARGKVRHPQHKTVILDGWHLVVPNTETAARDRMGRPILGRIAFTD